MEYYSRHKKLIIEIQQSPWYAALLIVLALGSGLLLLYEWWPARNEVVLISLLQFDLLVAGIFLIDFFLGLYVYHGYTNRLGYFKHNWMNLISSIPVTNEVTQFLRLLRIWRAWRVLRVAIGIHVLWQFFKRVNALLRKRFGF